LGYLSNSYVLSLDNITPYYTHIASDLTISLKPFSNTVMLYASVNYCYFISSRTNIWFIRTQVVYLTPESSIMYMIQSMVVWL